MPANYILLERIELNASAASVTFSNIPQTGYTDLKIDYSVRSDTVSTGDNIELTFNGSTSTYSRIRIYGAGSGTPASDSASTYTTMSFINGNGATANTFCNGSLYIPNYTSSNSKSFSIDVVQETNATATYMGLFAGLWATSTAISSINLKPNGGTNFVANSTFSLYGLAAVGTTPVIAPKASGGNRIDYDGTYWIHTFLTSGTFTPQTALSCDYLVVAGGGAGAPSSGTASGGGGAGGYRTSIGGSPLSLSATAYPVTIGAGAAGTTSVTVVSNGSNSVFSSITSTGGGGGGIAYGPSLGVKGGDGGSGGGSCAYYPNKQGAGNTPSTSPSQGNSGGNSVNLDINSGGGGGGSSAAGGNGSGSAGAGGAGTANSISGTSVTYAGGGGGGAETGTPGAGGAGGGGAGSNQGAGTNGTVNTGGGGGGSGDPMSGASAASGGSGIVIIRYLAA
jgi:hypothetical protein